MSLTLFVKDLEDGTGAALTTTGGSGVATVKVYRAVVTAGAVGSYVNIADGPALGNLSALLVPGTGYFYWYVTQSTNQSNTVFQPATEEGDSVWERCQVMVADRIAAIGLTGIPGGVVTLPFDTNPPSQSSVILGTKPDLAAFPRPFILVFAAGLTPENRGGPIMTDDIVYPVGVGLIGEDQSEDLERLRRRWKMYYERVERSLCNQRWDLRVPELINVETRMGVETEPGLLSDTMTRAGSMTALCVARMWRGVKRPNEP